MPKNMFDQLEEQATQRQNQTKAKLTKSKNPDTLTTMNLSLTVSDKKFLQVYAIEHDTTVAGVIHEFVEALRA